MKTLLMVVGVAWTGLLVAGETAPKASSDSETTGRAPDETQLKSETVQHAPPEEQLESEAIRRAQKHLVLVETNRQDRVERGNVAYSGLAVAAVKADNKLQLLNPAAPAEYGTVERSVVRDPVTGAASGLKIFSLEF